MNGGNRVVPNAWDKEADSLWGNGKRIEAIQAVLARVNVDKFKTPRLTLQAAYYLFLINDYPAGAKILEHQLAVTPNHFETLHSLAVCYYKLKRYADAMTLLQRARTIQPENYVAYDGLASSLAQLERYDEASQAGTRSLELKDRAFESASISEWSIPALDPQGLASKEGKRNVISYSLWGAGMPYLRGALRNLLLAHDMYPGWTLRFYLDASVPGEFVELAKRLGAEVVMQPPNQSLRQKLCWRFKVANDPGVGRFLVRDVDSVMNVREVQAVQAWLTSDKWFHVMRDWWTHTDLILAGMWGGVANVLPDLENMLMNYHSKTAETPNIDQWFLRDQIWGYIRQSCLVHDRYFHPAGVSPFPGPVLASDLHVGQDEFAAHGSRQERLLYPWIKSYSCLGPLRFSH